MAADPLTAHLRRWVGEWPPRRAVQVVGLAARGRPGWDGRPHRLLGVGDGVRTVIAVPPDAVEGVRAVIGSDLTDPCLGARLAPLLGMQRAAFGAGVFRWTHLPAALPAAGTWVAADDGRLPPWLAPFNGRRLVAFGAGGRYLAGIGIKHHDPYGREIAVVTTPAARGRGLARHMVVTAARRILADGAVPTYLHDPANTASARVAQAAGFPDRGWRVYGLWGR